MGHKAGRPVAFHRFLERVDGRPGAGVVSDLPVVLFEIAVFGEGALVQAAGAILGVSRGSGLAGLGRGQGVLEDNAYCPCSPGSRIEEALPSSLTSSGQLAWRGSADVGNLTLSAALSAAILA